MTFLVVVGSESQRRREERECSSAPLEVELNVKFASIEVLKTLIITRQSIPGSRGSNLHPARSLHGQSLLRRLHRATRSQLTDRRPHPTFRQYSRNR